MTEYNHTNARDFVEGDRVELHPALDAWMSGDKYGTVAYTPKTDGSMVTVDCTLSGKRRRLWPHNLRKV